MAKFKVGDKVIAKKNTPYSITTNGWRGEIVAIYDSYSIEVRGKNRVGKTNTWGVNSKYFDLDISNQKIVITTNGKTTTAKLYDGKNVIETAKAECHEGDKFDFNLGATIALSRLTGYEKIIEGFDWEAFKAGKIAIKVTKDNFKDFVTEAKKHKLTFKDNENFNPFEYGADFSIRFLSAMMRYKLDVKDNEIYIMYKDDSLKISHFLSGLEEFIWA